MGRNAPHAGTRCWAGSLASSPGSHQSPCPTALWSSCQRREKPGWETGQSPTGQRGPQRHSQGRSWGARAPHEQQRQMGVPLQSGEPRTGPAPVGTAPGPAAHLLRRMIRNSGSCRLVTDTYGSSNSCSFRTTAGKRQLGSGSGRREPLGSQGTLRSPGQGLLVPAQPSRQDKALWCPVSHRSLWGCPTAALTGESSVLGLSHQEEAEVADQLIRQIQLGGHGLG